MVEISVLAGEESCVIQTWVCEEDDGEEQGFESGTERFSFICSHKSTTVCHVVGKYLKSTEAELDILHITLNMLATRFNAIINVAWDIWCYV